MDHEKFEETPELRDSAGEKIVIFRRPDGTLFSNHPEYEFAMAMHKQSLAKVEAQPMPAEAEEPIEEDEAVEEDNGDGVVTYEEMTSADLGALLKERDITPPDKKRSTAIRMLQEYDEAQVAKAGS